MAARDGLVLLVEPVSHVDPLPDAVAVGDQQRRPVVGLGLAERSQRLLRVGAHRDPGDVHVGIRDRLEREVLGGHRLAGGRELRHRAERCRLGHLPARVGVDLGVEHEHVDVVPAGQDVIEAAGSDVVRPPVAADDPHATPDQMIDDAAQVGDYRFVALVEPPLQLDHPSALGTELGLPQLRRLENLVHQLPADLLTQLAEAPAGQLGVAVDRESQAEAELGVVLEQRVRPCRAVPVAVDGPRRRGQVPAVDRGAAGRVGDRQPVAEQLRDELQVWRLPAPDARTGELEQRLQELRAAHRAEVDSRAVVARQLLEERDPFALGGHQRLDRLEVDRLARRVSGRRDRTGLDAQPAPGAVLDVDLQRVARVRKPGSVERSRPEAVRRTVQPGLLVLAGADHAVRADEAAVAALDAQLGVPGRHDFGDVALLILRRAARVRAVHRQRTDRQLIPAAGHHRRGHGPHELRCVRGNHRRRLALGRHLLGHLYAVEMLQRAVDRRLVALYDLGAALAVGLGDRRLDPLDRRLWLEHARDREKAGLKHRIGPPGEARIACDLRRVDHVELDLLSEDLLLNRPGERVPDAVRGVSAVEQERRSRCRPIEHLGALEQPEVVAADETCLRDEVRRANRFRPEAQVRDRLRA